MKPVARRLTPKQARRLNRKKKRAELTLIEWKGGGDLFAAKVMRLKTRARREYVEGLGQAFVNRDPYNRGFTIKWG